MCFLVLYRVTFHNWRLLALKMVMNEFWWINIKGMHSWWLLSCITITTHNLFNLRCGELSWDILTIITIAQLTGNKCSTLAIKLLFIEKFCGFLCIFMKLHLAVTINDFSVFLFSLPYHFAFICNFPFSLFILYSKLYLPKETESWLSYENEVSAYHFQ